MIKVSRQARNADIVSREARGICGKSSVVVNHRISQRSRRTNFIATSFHPELRRRIGFSAKTRGPRYVILVARQDVDQYLHFLEMPSKNVT